MNFKMEFLEPCQMRVNDLNSIELPDVSIPTLLTDNQNINIIVDEELMVINPVEAATIGVQSKTLQSKMHGLQSHRNLQKMCKNIRDNALKENLTLRCLYCNTITDF
ncbi:uncharacterized protein [Chelonus insularis]|uniref:uncharacterized protein n=1 Tax=Chelonus insularis TaxID=460826 RepID=UPI00158D044C|nr:uncharacterized protein LOC118070411 [Chelonus insularis]